MPDTVVDLFCGLGGWAEGFLEENYDVIGFDIERRPYPGQLVLQDILTLGGAQLARLPNLRALVASPPCQEYSYMAMPWRRGKQIAAALRGHGSFPEEYDGSRTIGELNALFDACFRIQREASEAAGRYIPMVVENVKGAQPWVGRARANFGSFYLWGDVDSIGGRIVKRGDLRFGAPTVKAEARAAHKNGEIGGSWFAQGNGATVEVNHGRDGMKNGGGSWFNIGSPVQENVGQNPDGRKVPGLNWSGSDKPGYLARAFNTEADKRLRGGRKGRGGDGSQIPTPMESAQTGENRPALLDNSTAEVPRDSKHKPRLPKSPSDSPATSPACSNYEGRKVPTYADPRRNGGKGVHLTSPRENHEGVKVPLSGRAWFADGIGAVSSKSSTRKDASAQIAKIPFPLANHIARVFKP